MTIEDDGRLTEILKSAKTIAIVGASQDLSRDSTMIMQYLLKDGFDVIPVNPKYDEVLGKKCYPTVRSVGKPVDIVDVFRRSEFVNELAKNAVAAKAKVLWMQLGVINKSAAQYAADHGMKVVMNRCIMVEHRRLIK
ncbi:MAG: CoA-binding protein [Candidatus Kryptoniota bacterium]